MADQQIPGISFVRLFDLVYTNNFAKPEFSDRLLMGIFWEETLFNNRYQLKGGTGMGFGQVEPAQFYRMREFGLFVPPTKKVGGKIHAARPLSEIEAVQAACSMLASLRKALGSKAAALNGYAGVAWAEKNPGQGPTPTQRRAAVAGWQTCAAKLEDVRPFRRPTRDEENAIMSALGWARGFYPVRELFRPILFKASDY